MPDTAGEPGPARRDIQEQVDELRAEVDMVFEMLCSICQRHGIPVPDLADTSPVLRAIQCDHGNGTDG